MTFSRMLVKINKSGLTECCMVGVVVLTIWGNFLVCYSIVFMVKTYDGYIMSCSVK